MNKTYLEKVAERIRKLRTEKGLTQDDLVQMEFPDKW